MKNPQEIFNKIHEIKKEHKTIKTMYRDALESSHEYRDIVEKIDELKTKKKEIEKHAKEELGNDAVKLETLKLDLKGYKETLTDVAISTLMSGETVKVTDHENNEYEPVFSVRFKKTNVVKKEIV
jgi:hypothetical protein